MADSRIEKYRKYRESIAQQSDNIPVLKTPANDEKFSSEAGFFQKIILKRRIETSLILVAILSITTLLIVFGIIVF